jgi:uncharacterized RDD family membrane protein YckC
VKEIRNERARAAQGTRAGFVSQAIAMALDAGWILLEYLLLLLVFGLVRGLFTAHEFAVPKPPVWANVLSIFVIGVATLEAAWSGSGRAPGMGVLGLRVVAADGTKLSPRRAHWRAVIVVATLGLLAVTALFSRTNRSLYDRWCGSAVVYDWRAASRSDSAERSATPGS